MRDMAEGKWRYLPDYDNMAKLISSGDDEIIRWVEGRVNKMLIIPLKRIRKIFNRSTEMSGLKHVGLCITTVVLCASESFGRFLEGEGARRGVGRQCFKSFIKTYMPNLKRYQNILWNGYRNCLAHGFRIARGRIRTSIGCLYITPENSEMGVLEIELWNFFTEFTHAVERYFKELRDPTNNCLRKKFIDSFKSVYSYWIRFWNRKTK